MESLPGELALRINMTGVFPSGQKEAEEDLPGNLNIEQEIEKGSDRHRRAASFAQTSRELANKDAAKLQKLGK
ncbi:MAG: hypothetical protein II800_06235 [Lachnospiraceae bacterium]|nr:hypothetical protein [Lachnospiraceae bacterium]